jgi:hypothetical protein
MSIADRDTRAMVALAEAHLASKIREGETLTLAQYWERVAATLCELWAAERRGGHRRTAPQPRREEPKPGAPGIMLVSEEQNARAGLPS